MSDFPFSLALHPIWQTRCTLMAADCSIKAIVHAILMDSTSNSEMRKSFGPVAPYHPMSSTMNELMISLSYMIYLKIFWDKSQSIPNQWLQKKTDFCPVSPCIPPRGSDMKLRKGAQPFRKWAKRSWTHLPRKWQPPLPPKKSNPQKRARLSFFLGGGGGVG